jgi:poly(A) polymerase
MPAYSHAVSVVKKLSDHGFTAYFAGGWVRDFLMKRPSDDIDIATNASTSDVQKLFPKTIPVGVAFGIVIVVEQGFQFEVAAFRKDRGYVDGRRPTGVDPASAEEDAARRDFTINGMFYDPLLKKLYDYVGGQQDIEARTIRAIGDPNARFAEDRLRMMRAARYAARFQFSIEPATWNAIAAHAGQLLPAVAMERIWQEFKKMAQFGALNEGLILLHKLKLLPVIFPTLKTLSLQEIETRIQHLPRFPKEAPTLAQLLELFPDSSLQQILDLCDALKLSNKEKEFISFYHHAKTVLLMPDSWLGKLEKAEWAYLYANPHADLAIHIFSSRFSEANQRAFLNQHAKRKAALHTAIARIQAKNPVVKAEHLLKMGVAPGEKMGKLLKEAERIAINHALEEPSAVLNLLRFSL